MFKDVQRSVQSNDDYGLNRRRAWPCLVLALLFLYNPFFVIPGPSTGISACPPRSFRATIASSHLLTLKSGDSMEALAKPALDLAEGLTFVHLHSGCVVSIASDDSSIPDDQLRSGNLWFRPPPAANSLPVFQ